jgi:serine/threonine protein kinase
MAPEMVIMLSQARGNITGYTSTIDWWSLGATLFKLLTGARPFKNKDFQTFVDMATTKKHEVEHIGSTNKEYAILFQKIEFPSYVPEDAQDIVKRFLDVDPLTRLGANGIGEVKEHVFFKDIDWNSLELKHIEPPYLPSTVNSQSMKKNASGKAASGIDFGAALEKCGKSEWLTDACVPPSPKQRYFTNW